MNLHIPLHNSTYVPSADPSELLTCTLIRNVDGLLRTSTGWTGPLSSSTMYVD